MKHSHSSGPVLNVGLNRGFIHETEEAYLCEENMWWPKSHATIINGQIVVSRWVWKQKFGVEHCNIHPCEEYGESPEDDL